MTNVTHVFDSWMGIGSRLTFEPMLSIHINLLSLCNLLQDILNYQSIIISSITVCVVREEVAGGEVSRCSDEGL